MSSDQRFEEKIETSSGAAPLVEDAASDATGVIATAERDDRPRSLTWLYVLTVFLGIGIWVIADAAMM